MKRIVIILAVAVLAICFLEGVDEGMRQREHENLVKSYCSKPGHLETLCHGE